MVACEANVEELRAGGEGQREGWAAASLKKARQKVPDKEDNMRQLKRSVRRLEEWVAREAKVKEEVVDEVLEVEVEVEVEEMVEENVKEEVEERATAGGGGMAEYFFERVGGRAAWAIMDVPWNSAHQTAANPHLVPTESVIWTRRFLTHRVRHNISGHGGWVRVDEGETHQDKAVRVGGVAGKWWCPW